MKKFDIAFDEPFSQIDVLVDDDVLRLADGEEPPDADADAEEDDEDGDGDEETEDEETDDEDADDELERG
jgi:hypothetical protein